ncbi:MAG: hypothetical protein AAF939_11355, partial [Planctomycetota bacterium]
GLGAPSIIYGQDLEAVERRLGGAIESGEISIKHAHIMMEALKEAVLHEHHEYEHHGHEHEHHEHEHHEHEHHEHHEHGEYENGHHEHEHGDEIQSKIFDELEEVGIEAEVIEPTIELIEKIANQMQQRPGDFKLDRRMIDYMVDRLGLDRSQIRKILSISEWVAEIDTDESEYYEESSSLRERYLQMERRVEAAVDRGDLSEREAEQKLLQIQRELLGRQERDEKQNNQEKKYQRMIEQIQHAVQAGDLDEFEAEQRIFELRRMRFQDNEDSSNKLEQRKRRFRELEKQLQAAVRNGDLSEL